LNTLGALAHETNAIRCDVVRAARPPVGMGPDTALSAAESVVDSLAGSRGPSPPPQAPNVATRARTRTDRSIGFSELGDRMVSPSGPRSRCE
jgi:hypothetical protein